MAKINIHKPVFVNGEEVTVLHRFPCGRFVAIAPGENHVRQFSAAGRATDAWYDFATNEAPLITEVVSLYPNGGIYVKDVEVRSSMYGVKNLIQVRVTRRGDQIVKKELLP